MRNNLWWINQDALSSVPNATQQLQATKRKMKEKYKLASERKKVDGNTYWIGKETKGAKSSRN